MSIERKIEYNKRQSSKYGWTPEDFGADEFDAELINQIMRFQELEGLDVDGYAGPSTYRRLVTVQEADKESVPGDEHIIIDGKKVQIHWKNVIVWNEEGGKKASKGHFSSYEGKKDRDIKFFVTHWDVCLSANSCYKVLEKRGISVHFGIDNDGTIYQWVDLKNAAWHAGGRSWNHSSVGVEISNAYSPKYQAHYQKRYGARPVWEGVKVHGKSLKPFLGFYDVQIAALAALWEAVSRACGIPLVIPDGPDAVYGPAADNNWRGFLSHFHLKRGKIDCAGLDHQHVLNEAKRIREEHEAQ